MFTDDALTGMAEYEIPYPRLGSTFGAEELAVLAEVLGSGLPLSAGRWREAFEHQFRNWVGSAHAFSVTSGTVALDIAIRLLDLRAGDEVIATPQTYQATVQALLGTRVVVRFCDVSPNSLNLDPARLAELITDRTRAVLLVHYGGLPAEMAEIMALTRPRGIVVVEDCAHALGASYRGARPGVLADIGCFSFHSSKIITTLGEGGMITFDRNDWAERVDRIRGNECDGIYRPAPNPLPEVPKALYPGRAHTHTCLAVRDAGTNATMSEPAAAVGTVQLARIGELGNRRRAIAEAIDAQVRELPELHTQAVPAGVTHARHLYTCFTAPDSGVSRDAFVMALEELGVQVWLRYFPLHLLPEWRARGHHLGECRTAERIWFEELVNLPLHPAMTDSQVERLLTAVRKAVAMARG